MALIYVMILLCTTVGLWCKLCFIKPIEAEKKNRIQNRSQIKIWLIVTVDCYKHLLGILKTHTAAVCLEAVMYDNIWILAASEDYFH